MNYRRGQAPLPPRLTLSRLGELRVNDPRCACGKERFYSEEAARAGLLALMARRIIQLGEVSERDVYMCRQGYLELGEDIWHLTSNDGREKNLAVKAKQEERLQGKSRR